MLSETVREGQRAFARRDLDEAERLAGEALATDPKDGAAIELRGAVAFHRGDPDTAFELLHKARETGYESGQLYTNLGVMYLQAGDFKNAETYARRAIVVAPRHTEAYHLLAHFYRFEPDDPLIEQVEALLRKEMSKADRGTMCFFAGKMYADLGRYDEAFRYYAEGNRLLREPFDRRPIEYIVDRSRQLLTREFFAERSHFGHESDAPIFVVGLPSSGSTLVEQILARHPEIHGAGEISDINLLARGGLQKRLDRHAEFPDILAHLDPDTAHAAAAEYLVRRREKAGDARRIVDKAPINYLNIGLIALLFPNARIIRTVRDPMDTGVSCFFRRFIVGQQFTYDLADLGFVMRRESAIVKHWVAHAPLPILNLRYENLVTNPAGFARQIVAFAGVDWDPACLDAETGGTDRVYNASTYAVRQPINTSSIGKWKRYAQQLGVLQQALKRDIPPVADGSRGATAAPATESAPGE